MIQRDEIRDKINRFCMENVFNGIRRYAGFGSSPLAIVLYIGDKTVHDLEAQMKGAFDSLLNIRPEVRVAHINRENIISESMLKNSLIEIFSELNEKGFLVSGRMVEIQLSFVAMMDDPIFCEENALDGIRKMKNQLDKIESLGIVHFGRFSFYGIFDQRVTKHDYDYSSAFRFITEGSIANCGLWHNVYHLQKMLFENSFELTARTVAFKILRDSVYQPKVIVRETSDIDDYSWSYLGMDEMQLPELLICNILISAYGAQLIDSPLNQQDRMEFKRNLEKVLLDYIGKTCRILKEPDWVRYLPMHVRQTEEPRRRGIFSRRYKNTYSFVNYSEMLINKEMVGNILKECIEEKVAEMKDSEQLLSVIRSSFSALAHFDTVLPRLRADLLDTVRELIANFEKRSYAVNLEGSIESEESYFGELFRQYAEKELLETAIYVLKSGVDNKEFESGINDLLESMKSDCEKTRQILEELRINSYGGAEALKLPDLVHNLQITIGTPVQDACKAIDRKVLDTLVDDEMILKENATAFLSRVQSSSTIRNSIGQVCGNHMMMPLEYEIFVAKPIEENGMMIRVNSIFRANTMQVLSYSEWSSMKNLSAYYSEG